MRTISDKVNDWPNGKEGPVLLVRKLRTSAFPLTSKQIFVVLEALETTCPRCWNTDISGDRQCDCKASHSGIGLKKCGLTREQYEAVR